MTAVERNGDGADLAGRDRLLPLRCESLSADGVVTIYDPDDQDRRWLSSDAGVERGDMR